MESNFFSVLATVFSLTLTASISLIVFYLGKMNNQRYGIRLIDLVVDGIGYSNLLKMAETFFFELLFSVIAIIGRLVFTSFSCVLYVVVLIGCIFSYIFKTSSTEYVRNIIIRMAVKEIGGGNSDSGKYKRNLYLSRVVFSADYKSALKKEELISLYFDVLNKCNELKYEYDLIWRFSKQYMEMIIEAAEASSDIYNLSVCLLDQANGNQGAQRGLLAALLCKMEYDDLIAVLKTQFRNRFSLLLWGMVYCIFNSQYLELQFLRIRAKKISEILSAGVSDEIEKDWKENLFIYWGELVMGAGKDENGRYNMRFDIMYKCLIS